MGDQDDAILDGFDYVIPVFHKDESLAYLLLSDVKEERTISPVVRNLNFLQTLTNVIVVAIENKRLFNHKLLREREDQELELAGKIMLNLLPESFPDYGNLKAEAFFKSHMKVGGDYYDIIENSKGKYTMLMADISGKGMSAALIMSNFQAYFKLACEIGLKLPELVSLLNEKVFENTKGEMFITLIVANYDAKSRELEYINAAHPAGILIENNEHKLLESDCRALGIETDLKVQSTSLKLQTGARLVTFTDGLTELFNRDNQAFDEGRIAEVLLDSQDLDIQRINRLLIEKALDFAGRLGMDDDLALLCVEFS